MSNSTAHSLDLISTTLFDETSFYTKFKADLHNCQREVIIESPFVSTKRTYSLIQDLEFLVRKNVKVFIITRDPVIHSEPMKFQAEEVIQHLEAVRIQVFISAYQSHRKMAILDRHVLWEGSLNILSHSNSREIMRRIENETIAQECFDFVGLHRYIH